MSAIIFFYFSFLLSTFLVPVNIYLGRKAGIVDKPDPRKIHSSIIPRTGGVAIALSVFLPLLVRHFESSLVWGYIAGSLCIIIFGLLDDFKDLSYQFKFLGQILASLAFVLVSSLSVECLGELWPGLHLGSGPLAIPLTMFFLLAVTNIINLSDGMDGLAGGLTLLSLLCCGALAGMQGDFIELIMTVSILGALIGFLRYNIHPARVFLGDTGSQFLGFSLGVLLLSVTQGNSIYSPVLPLFILGTPILDTALVMYERLSLGLSPFRPDKRHLHHKLLQFGFSHEHAVIWIYVFHFLLILAGWNMRFGPDYVVFYLYLGLFVSVLGVRMSSLERQKWFKDLLRPFFQALLQLKTRTSLPWSRYYISKFCWSSFFLLFAASYFTTPLYSFQVQPLIGWGSLLLVPVLLLLVRLSPEFPVHTIRIVLYLTTLYLVVLRGSSSLGLHLFGYGLELETLLFALITAFYFLCLLLTPEESPLNAINYLAIALAVFVAQLPLKDQELGLLQHVVSTSIFFGLYINLIFSRIQRNTGFVMTVQSFALLAVFVRFLLG